jgi:hypothetical protein
VSINVLSCIANGQPDDLFGCLDGYVQNAGRHGHAPRFVIIDMTLDATRRNASRDVADRVHRSRKVAVECITGREIDRFLARASKYSWVDAPSMTYALMGDGRVDSNYGAACNISALLAGASKSLVVSASTRCDVVGAPGGVSRLCLNSRTGCRKIDPFSSDVERLLFFGSMGEADAKLHHLRDEDVLGDVARFLGGCQTKCAATLGTSGQIGTGHIGAVSLGTWGDVGVESSRFYLLSRQAQAIAEDDDVYIANKSNRVTARIAQEWITESVNLRLAAFGLSGDSVPFLPTESVNGGMAGQSLSGLLMGFRSQSVLALPFAVKSSSHAVLRPVTSLTDLIAVAVDSFRPRHSLAEIGAALVARSEDRSFLSMVTSTWDRYLFGLARARREAVGSEMMRGDLDAGFSMPTPGRAASELVPYELRSDADPMGDIFFSQVSQFGRLLTAWPGLVVAVSDLSNNGIRLGT